MRIKRVNSDVGEKVASIALWLLGLGVILAIWGGVWSFYLFRNPPERELMAFFAAGLLLSGLDLIAIGLLSGRIGRAARDRDEPADRVAVSTPDRTGHTA
ncbi:hypothetical protein [Tautonia plasticadhaerens]|uniref:Uncharacterized protein n=1 Tax=Tautonia plasticadhaerens TaxID=2527974 RepID=A0A518H6L7_9BACT|nr:hypothetical protein [Tautonia plasticadhaerens]QDV36500.1 hypothetical protein ElP_44260 [Tautonia plasticadhaerens]